MTLFPKWRRCSRHLTPCWSLGDLATIPIRSDHWIASLHRNRSKQRRAASGHSRRFAAMLQRQHTFQSGRLHRRQHRYHPHMNKQGSVTRPPVMPGDGQSDPIAAVRRLSRRATNGRKQLQQGSLDYLLGLSEQRWRNVKADSLCTLEIDQ